MNKLVLIFDYFKEAFHINKQNKSLYKPQIALIAIKVLLILFVGIGVYNWVGAENIKALTNMEPGQIFGFILSQGLKLIAVMLSYALASVVFEAGLLNMYKKAVTQSCIEAGDFREGISKYFFKLLLGEIFIILCYILAFIPYLIMGLLSLTIGFSLIPIVAGVFLTMWKVSLVMNDTGIFAAIKDSFSFASRNFIPLSVLQIIHWAFTRGAAGGRGSANFNFPSSDTMENDFANKAAGMPGFEEVIRVVKIVIAILIPIITIAAITVSVVSIIFEVFFSLVLFVTYKNGFKPQEPAADDAQENDAEEIDVTASADISEANIGEVEQ